MQPTIQVASLGFENSIILMVLALVVFGPRRLPEIGRRIGKIMYEVRKASNDFKFQMEEELRVAEEAERRKKEEERLSALASSEQSAAASPAPQAASAAPVESPYPNGAVYPPVVSAAAASEEPYPRILPPSTGEQVPAARPGKRPAQAKSSAAKKSARTTKGKPAATKAPARVKKTSKTPGRRS
ncbi:MAG: twin-arginine translocase TatA/TatE family subunit [Terracidiphilus sp.]